MNQPSWDDLRTVLAVARSGTIGAGAASLGINPTTVTRRIRALEDDIGTQLFEKLKHGVVLTAAGHELVHYADRMHQLANELDARIHGLDSRLEGTVRVTAADFVMGHFIADFCTFRSRYPDVHLELTSSYQMANLTQREADVAIRVAREAPPHLVGRRHAEVFFAIYGHHRLVEEIGEDAPYDAYPWLGWDLSVGRATDDYLAAHVPKARVVTRVDSHPLMLEALRARMGITILPCLSGDPVPDLRRVGPYFEGGTFLWVLTHAELRGTARIRAFIEWARQLIERDRAAIEGCQ